MPDARVAGFGGLLLIREWKPVRGLRAYLPLTDGLCSVCGLIDASDGSLAAEYDYDPYGNPVVGCGPAIDACPFRHRTRYYDPETWLYYYGYRYYDPSVTKWISKDPLGEAGGWNLTCFCDNDPVNQYDPLGLDASIGYRPLDITGLTETFPVTGHSFLIFNNKNMGTAWRAALQSAGFDPNIPHIEMSFHPDYVPSGDTSMNRISVFVTDSSAVTYNRPEDSAVAEGRSGKMYLVTPRETEQIRLFILALASADINNASPEGHDDSGPYSFPKNNCSSWAKDMCDAAGLRPIDHFAYAKMNMGVGQETGLDLTGVPQATYALARGSVVVCDVSKPFVVTTARTASGVGRAVYTTVHHAVNSTKIIVVPSKDESLVGWGIGWRF